MSDVRSAVPAFVLAAAVSAGAASFAAADRDLSLTVTPLAAPAGANTAEPQLTTEGHRTILSWVDLSGNRAVLKFAERTAAGWSDTRTVTPAVELMVNASDVPAVRALADGTLAAQWLQQNGPDPESYDLRIAFSKDNGATWSATATPHHDGKETQHGFASLFQTPGAGFGAGLNPGLGIVWLDGRQFPPDAPEGVGDMSLRAATFDTSGTQRGEVAIDTRVCDCCPTSAAATSEGVIVAYRNRSANEIRDIYVSRYVGGRWLTPTAVHNDGWRIKACPVNGPSISARGRDVVVAWFTAAGGKGRTFAAFSHDAGRTFGAPVRVDDVGSIGRVGVQLLPDDSAAVAWIEFASEHSQFEVRRVDQAGLRGPAVTVAAITGTRYPRLGWDHAALMLAWTETVDDVPQVRTAHAALPEVQSSGN